MEAAFKHPGDVIPYTPSSDVALGQVVVLGELVLVAVAAIAADELGHLATSGVYEVPKASGSSTAISAGAIVYWDDTNNVITTTSSGNKKMGYTYAASVDGDTTQRVLLER